MQNNQEWMGQNSVRRPTYQEHLGYVAKTVEKPMLFLKYIVINQHPTISIAKRLRQSVKTTRKSTGRHLNSTNWGLTNHLGSVRRHRKNPAWSGNIETSPRMRCMGLEAALVGGGTIRKSHFSCDVGSMHICTKANIDIAEVFRQLYPLSKRLE